jgi:hypothetical protein
MDTHRTIREPCRKQRHILILKPVVGLVDDELAIARHTACHQRESGVPGLSRFEPHDVSGV